MSDFKCDHCGELRTRPADSLGTGYAYHNEIGKVCYRCCAQLDKKEMCENGRIVLYLTDKKVTNWPGSLVFYTGQPRRGRHNMSGVRYDVWFTGPDRHVWHGVKYGDDTQIVHCKRTKEKVA